MIGIVGINLKPAQVKNALTKYLVTYFEAMDQAIKEAGGSLRTSIMGDDPWRPTLPQELHPDWATSVRAQADGSDFYSDLDGPALHDVFVTQAITIRLEWRDEESTSGFNIVGVDVDPLQILLLEDQSLDLGSARAVTSGLLAAGKLMAQLLEAPQGVR
ncbi:hypothetical protein J7E68_06470 [Microbacterium sp. ISL-103]|uniref:hypothetical protein n=1 Tax=Microbacterium sp. ISL-103 TaxID=2819156 RepID=UPI001BEC2B25|nr:hypothetical protein [Microbacterium sp. ISL-103]MBT2474230.1 hypothetical protein [Microbacterium sp. ISL-103]